MRSFPILAAAVIASGLSAQATTAKYEVYGHGCAGTGPDPISCGSLNSNGGPLRQGTLPNEYCYHHKAASAIEVYGIQLWTSVGGTNASELTGIGLYRMNAAKTGPEVDPVAVGTMRVTGATAAFHTGYFDMPVKVAKDEEFWISQFDTTKTLAAGLTTGTAATGTTYWRRPANGSGNWSPTGIVRNPSYHILCQGTTGKGTGIPNLMHTGVPKLGTTFSVDLHHAPITPAFLLIGVSDTTAWGAPLPLDLGIFGAPDCSVYASAEFILSAGVAVNGSLSMKLSIPNDTKLVGLNFYNQFYLSEPTVNNMKLTTTNAGKATVGN